MLAGLPMPSEGPMGWPMSLRNARVHRLAQSPLRRAACNQDATSEGQLRRLPAALDAPNLKILKAEDNQLTAFPPALLAKPACREPFYCVWVEEAHLRGNAIAHLPASFGDLGAGRLSHLHLAYNDLRELPESIGELVALEKLEGIVANPSGAAPGQDSRQATQSVRVL